MEKINEKILLKNFDVYEKLVADAYDNAPDYEPDAEKHWNALNQSNHKFFKQLLSRTNVVFVSTDKNLIENPRKIHIAGKEFDLVYGDDPYSNQADMKRDYDENKEIKIMYDFSNHPYFSPEDNIVFRTVHDFIVHIGGNYPFGTKGEIQSYNLHAKLAPREALPALFTEIVGQVSYATTRGSFPKQKVAVLKGFDYKDIGKVDDYVIKDKELEPINERKDLFKLKLVNSIIDSILNKIKENSDKFLDDLLENNKFNLDISIGNLKLNLELTSKMLGRGRFEGTFGDNQIRLSLYELIFNDLSDFRSDKPGARENLIKNITLSGDDSVTKSKLETLRHELIHFLDKFKYFDKDTAEKHNYTSDFNKYFNTSHEYNAFFLSKVDNLIKDFDFSKEFNTFKDEFINNHFIDKQGDKLFDILNDKRQKQLLKRLYEIYMKKNTTMTGLQKENLERLLRVNKQLNLIKENVDIPDEYKEFDEFEFHGSAKDAAKADIESEHGEGSFKEVGQSKYEKGVSEKDMADELRRANLDLPSDKAELEKIYKQLKDKEEHEKRFGVGSLNEGLDSLINELYEASENLGEKKKLNENPGFGDDLKKAFTKKAVGVLIQAKDTGRILLLQRSFRMRHRGHWNLVSGFVDKGEDVFTALKREVSEELSINPEIIDYNLISTELDDYNNIEFTFYSGIVNEEFRPNLDSENSAFEWVELTELPSPLFPKVGTKITNLYPEAKMKNSLNEDVNMNLIMTRVVKDLVRIFDLPEDKLTTIGDSQGVSGIELDVSGIPYRSFEEIVEFVKKNYSGYIDNPIFDKDNNIMSLYFIDKSRKLDETTKLNEYEVFDSKKIRDERDNIIYKFNANGINYRLAMWHDSNKHSFGVYEVEFSVSGQEHTGERVGKDLEHLNSVLYTVTNIIEKEVKDKKIKTIKIEGARGEQDRGGLFDDTVRTRLYLRFLNNRYPNDAIKTGGRIIEIDMTKVFPELATEEKSRKDILLDEVYRISDAALDKDGINRGVDGTDDGDFTISTDFIVNEKYGGINLILDVSDSFKEYNIEWEFFDEDNSGSEYFDKFEDLLSFVQKFPENVMEKELSENRLNEELINLSKEIFKGLNRFNK